MISRNVFTLAAALCLLATAAVAQTPVKELEGTTSVEFPAPEGGAVVLFDQTDNASGSSTPDQDFEDAFDVYDSEAADDFDVDFPDGWTIQQINTQGLLNPGANPGATSVMVTMYADNGGTPLGGDVICSYPGFPPTADTLGSLTIDLPEPCILPPGLHWVAIQTTQNFGVDGQRFWANRAVDSNAPGHWRNPLDGFGTGCTDWMPAGAVCGVGGGFNDLLFTLVGEEGGFVVDGGVDPTEIPTLGQFGIAALLLSLLGAGIFRLRRRS